MNALKNKIKSQRGASITFALLLFLVCAIISSIVIVAATAVGGRASKLAEMDQRYYAVNSAAELLRDVLEGQTVVVTTGTKTVTKMNSEGNAVSTETENLDPVITLENGISGKIQTGDRESLLTSAALKIAGQYADLPDSLILKAVKSSAEEKALGVTLTPIFDETSKNLYIDVSNADTTKGVYTLRLTFKASAISSESTSTNVDVEKSENTETNAKNTTIRWRLIKLQTVIAAAPVPSAPTPKPEGGV